MLLWTYFHAFGRQLGNLLGGGAVGVSLDNRLIKSSFSWTKDFLVEVCLSVFYFIEKVELTGGLPFQPCG